MEKLLVLRIWIALTGCMAIIQGLQCLVAGEDFIARKIFTAQPDQVTPLTARLFAMWIILAGGIRLGCGYNIYNEHLFHATIYSYLLALYHFVTELVVFKTAGVCTGTVAPIIVAGGTALFMLFSRAAVVKANRKKH